MGRKRLQLRKRSPSVRGSGPRLLRRHPEDLSHVAGLLGHFARVLLDIPQMLGAGSRIFVLDPGPLAPLAQGLLNLTTFLPLPTGELCVFSTSFRGFARRLTVKRFRDGRLGTLRGHGGARSWVWRSLVWAILAL